MKLIRCLWLVCAAVAVSVMLCHLTQAHPIGPLGNEPLAWQSEHVDQVVGGGSSLFTHPHEVQVLGRKCISGGQLHFGVRDDYAFDIDETVEVEIEFYLGNTPERVTLTYDRADSAPFFTPVFDGKADPLASH